MSCKACCKVNKSISTILLTFNTIKTFIVFYEARFICIFSVFIWNALRADITGQNPSQKTCKPDCRQASNTA